MDVDDQHDRSRPCSEAHPETEIYCYPPEHPLEGGPDHLRGAAAMRIHRLPNSGLELELVDGFELTPEQEELLDAYLPVVVDYERERWAALTPAERVAEPKAWRAAADSPVRGRG